jgi:hypothetical protein
MAESLSMQASDLLDQAQDVEADAPTVPRDAIIRNKKRSVGDNDARRYGICGASVIEQKQGPLHARDFVPPLICQELISAPGPDR